ncbi:MAG TPA: hypothetical protein VJW73_05535, partial [Gemmatimonadaceae bacterium]|nr:hypothetical protein [Gemmatimonadaceae bacterium]
MARLAAFILAILSGAWLFSLPSESVAAAAALIVSVALFLALVALHARTRAAERHARDLSKLNSLGVARVRRDWPSLPLPREIVPLDHPYASDLDVAGTTASLFRLLDVVSAATGRPVLLRWLLGSPPSLEELAQRQQAVAELAAAVELREELCLLARRGHDIAPEQLTTFFGWSESEPWLRSRPLLLWTARIIPIVTVATALLAFFGRLPSTAPLLSIVVGLFVLARHRSAMNEHLASVLRRGTGLRSQREMLDVLTRAQFSSPLLQREQSQAVTGTVGLRALERSLSLLEGQGSLVHAILAALVLWDVHALAWLDRWR